jgi:hypothetical protein
MSVLVTIARKRTSTGATSTTSRLTLNLTSLPLGASEGPNQERTWNEKGSAWTTRPSTRPSSVTGRGFVRSGPDDAEDGGDREAENEHDELHDADHESEPWLGSTHSDDQERTG